MRQIGSEMERGPVVGQSQFLESLANLFVQANTTYPKTQKSWIDLSHKLGGCLPRSLLVGQIQDIGSIDVLLRCLEDETSSAGKAGPNQPDLPFGFADFGLHYQSMLSRLWVSDAYEAARLLKARRLVMGNASLVELEYDLKLVRITLDKHEIANEPKMKPRNEPLVMQELNSSGVATGTYLYQRDDNMRAHIMTSGVSERGSMMWEGLDAETRGSKFIERRDLADRFLGLRV